MKYLIAEDEIDLRQSIVDYLERDGNICEVVGDFKYKNRLLDTSVN